ncbi:MAG TPA: HEPN domain-containing protein [Candidatus Acidoferrales bacterium]|nr:HEPN domain-containing protein [Candidatus Acidoferrales bacterium]
MTSAELARSYIWKAETRIDALEALLRRNNFSDVVREAQETVELALKGMLRAVGVEPPKHDDVGGLLAEHRERFPKDIRPQLRRAAEISKRLRKEREIAFYGDVDFIPTEEYSSDDGRRALEDAKWVVELAKKVLVK